jgi:hypothetical protein
VRTLAALAAALALSAEPPARKDTTKRAPAPLSAEDAEVVANLELLQKLELLQDLHIVDTGDAVTPPPPAPGRADPEPGR